MRRAGGQRGGFGWVARPLAVVGFSLTVLILGPTARSSAAEHAPVDQEPPSITGTARPGGTLTATAGAWTEEPTGFSYRWERCFWAGGCLVDQESGDPTYVVQPKDADQQVAVTVTASNTFGSASAKSAPVAVERSWRFSTGAPRTEIASWSATEPEPAWSTEKALSIGVSSGMCVGEGRPSIADIHVEERPPSAAFPFPSAIVTTSVLFPEPTEVVGTVNPGEVMPACAGIGIGLGRTVRLGRPVARLFVFDGSTTPPRLVLQPAKILHWHRPLLLGPRLVGISVPFEGCAGLSISAHVVERPGRTIITAYGAPPTHRGQEPCLRVHGIEHLRLKFKVSPKDVELRDGSLDPPVTRVLTGPSPTS